MILSMTCCLLSRAHAGGGGLPRVNVGLEGGGKVMVQVQSDCWRCPHFESQCMTLLMRKAQTSLQSHTWELRACSFRLHLHTHIHLEDRKGKKA